MAMKLSGHVRSNVIGYLALFVALSGTAWAATELDKNEVKSKHIGKGQVKNSDLGNNSVTSPKVADGSLLDDDFAPGQLPAGPQGPQGPEGPQGEPGTPGAPGQDATTLFAYVRDPGAGATENALIQYGKGATTVSELATDGVYDVTFNQSVANCVAHATPGMGDPQGPLAAPGGGYTAWTGLAADPGNVANTLRVVTYSGGTSSDASFQVSVFC